MSFGLFICALKVDIIVYIRETVRFIALEKIFVKQSFLYFIFKHSYGCAPFQFKRKVIPNLK